MAIQFDLNDNRRKRRMWDFGGFLDISVTNKRTVASPSANVDTTQ